MNKKVHVSSFIKIYTQYYHKFSFFFFSYFRTNCITHFIFNQFSLKDKNNVFDGEKLPQIARIYHYSTKVVSIYYTSNKMISTIKRDNGKTSAYFFTKCFVYFHVKFFKNFSYVSLCEPIKFLASLEETSKPTSRLY